MSQATLSIRIWNNDGNLPDDLSEAFAPHAEHVTGLLRTGYVAGEIVDDNFRGWWKIETD